MSNFNPLCLDLADLRPLEKRLLHLHGRYGLSVSELADVFDAPTDKVKRMLHTAKRKYNVIYRRVKWY
jgi:DNA-directed RNA polymerase specialized sigma24 family protein